MKQMFYKKTAQVTVLMLIISVLMPVLAFAATVGFQSVTYTNGTVTAYVYSDADTRNNVNNAVYVRMKGNNTPLPVGTATYSTYDSANSRYIYSYTGFIGTGYNPLEVSAAVYYNGGVFESVYQTVPANNTNNNNNSDGSSGGGGGGGGVVAGATITVNADGTIDATALTNALTANDVVELKLSGDNALIPAKALVSFTGNKNKTLKISNSKGTYILPIYVLDLTDLATKLSTTVDELIVKVSISTPSATDVADIKTAATTLGGTVLSESVDFMIAGLAKDGKTQAADLGSNYISRVLPLTKTADVSRATAVVFDPASKKVSFVPALFSSNGTTNEATIKRNSSSIYTVLEFNKNFMDSKGHWAQGYIDLLANKLVIDGVTDTTFEPERNITRAEFAALVVRSLGLAQETGSSSFKDVTSGDWFAGVVGAATKAKIIDGYEDLTFRPNQPIKREELAAMVVRALNYAGAKPTVSADRQAELLAKYTDASQIVWAQNEVATAVEAGIVDGMTDTTIAPTNQATRAQSATMLKRLLTKANFIN